jgi:hypothetical protein
MTNEHNTQILELVNKIVNLKDIAIGFTDTVLIGNDEQNAFIQSIFNNQSTELNNISKELLKLCKE